MMLCRSERAASTSASSRERHGVRPQETSQHHHIGRHAIVEFIADPGAAENVLALFLGNQESVTDQRMIESVLAIAESQRNRRGIGNAREQARQLRLQSLQNWRGITGRRGNHDVLGFQPIAVRSNAEALADILDRLDIGLNYVGARAQSFDQLAEAALQRLQERTAGILRPRLRPERRASGCRTWFRARRSAPARC